MHGSPKQVRYPKESQYFGAWKCSRSEFPGVDHKTIQPSELDFTMDTNGQVKMLLPTYDGLRLWVTHPECNDDSTHQFDFAVGKNETVMFYMLNPR